MIVFESYLSQKKAASKADIVHTFEKTKLLAFKKISLFVLVKFSGAKAMNRKMSDVYVFTKLFRSGSHFWTLFFTMKHLRKHDYFQIYLKCIRVLLV